MRILLSIMICMSVVGAATGAEAGSPGYRGNGSGVSPSQKTPLAQPVRRWESEEAIPIPWITSIGCMGGYGSIAFDDQRAFLSYYEPTGTFVQEDKLRRIQKKKGPERYALTDASDVLLCMDLKTGKTLWKAVQEGRGYNPCALGGELYVTPCIVGDRVYNYGNLGVVYCHDVRTGEVVWETWLSEGVRAHELMQAWKEDEKRYEQDWPKGKIRVLAMKSHHNAARARSPVIVGGVLVVHDFNDGLVGLDATTGAVLWDRKGLLSGNGSTPVAFGSDRVLAGAKWGLVCLDASSGKTVWSIPDKERMFGCEFGLAVSGTTIVSRGGFKKGQVTCWTVDGDAPVLKWQGPAAMPASCGVMILDGQVWGVFRKEGSPKNKDLAVLRAFDLASGKETGMHDIGDFKTNYTHLAASDGLIGMSSYGANGTWLYVPDPKNPRPHADMLPGTTYCITPAMADGLLLTRTRNRVVCWQIGR